MFELEKVFHEYHCYQEQRKGKPIDIKRQCPPRKPQNTEFFVENFTSLPQE